MGRPRGFDEDVALAKAVKTFWKNGYFDTSIGMLEREMGINRFSIYSTFKSKDELFKRALRAYRDQILGGFLYLEADGADATSVEKFFRHLLEQYDASGENYGCLMVNTAAELAAHGHPACAEFADYEKYLTDLFKKALENGKAGNQIDADADPGSLATFFFGMVLGMSVYAKCNPGKTTLVDFVDHGLSVLRASPSQNRRRR